MVSNNTDEEELIIQNLGLALYVVHAPPEMFKVHYSIY